MSLPLVGMLRSAGGVRLCLMCPSYTARVYWGIVGIEEIIIFSNKGFTRGLRARSRILRRLRPDAAIVLPPSFSSAMAPAAARIPFRVGYRTDGRGCLLNPAIPTKRLRAEHLSRSYEHLGTQALACIGAAAGSPDAAEEREASTTGSSVPTPKLAVFADERASLEHTLRERGAPIKGFCLMVPGATYGNAKTWPQEAFRETARSLSQTMPVVLAGGKAESGVCAGIAASAPGIYDVSGETSLGEFFGLVEAADVLIANDSGAAHVAGSIGTPSVVIFGSTSPRWTAPLGDRVVIVRHPTLCSPCYLKKCPTKLECFAGIQPQYVVEQVLRLVKKGVDILPSGG